VQPIKLTIVIVFASFSCVVADNCAISLAWVGIPEGAWYKTIKNTMPGWLLAQCMASTSQSPAFKGHDLPRLRGVMSPNEYRDDDLRELGVKWKANVIRWQIKRNGNRVGADRDLLEFDRWLDRKLDELDRVLVACGRYGMKVVVDMHSPPGGRYPNSDLAIFNESKYQDHWLATWERIARRYKGNMVIWGYDLVNEPVQNARSPGGMPDYLGAQIRVAKAIRIIDPDMPIMIEASHWDSAAGYHSLEPVLVSNVIYQVHLYLPMEFTHQGVTGTWTQVTYPGKIGSTVWDKQQLRKVLQPVRNFQLANGAHIYVGEFSAVRWAPGAADYLRDCIDLFEEYGWDWTYHAYREWDGWSVEHGSDPNENQPSKEMTDRMRLLLDWFGKNIQPRRDVEGSVGR
jgi:endoglucanase